MNNSIKDLIKKQHIKRCKIKEIISFTMLDYSKLGVKDLLLEDARKSYSTYSREELEHMCNSFILSNKDINKVKTDELVEKMVEEVEKKFNDYLDDERCVIRIQYDGLVKYAVVYENDLTFHYFDRWLFENSNKVITNLDNYIDLYYDANLSYRSSIIQASEFTLKTYMDKSDDDMPENVWMSVLKYIRCINSDINGLQYTPYERIIFDSESNEYIYCFNREEFEADRLRDEC